MASATSSRPTSADRRRRDARVADARALETPLRSLAAARKAAPLLYLELNGSDNADGHLDSAQRSACMRAVSAALACAAGSVLRKKDVVVAGPGARWFAALLVDRAVAGHERAAVADADLAAAASRLRALVQAALDGLRERGELSSRATVRAGWSVIEPRDRQAPLSELRHAIRGAAVIARVEERRATVLAAVTHELRTPLTSIVGFVERLAEDGAVRSAPARRALAIVADESRRLARLIEGLIDAGSWHAGSLSLHRTKRRLRPIVDRGVASVDEAARARGVRIAVRGDAEATVDADRIAQVVVNLIDNAVRHAAAGGHVRIAIGSGRRAATISVADDGAGFPIGAASSIGTPFSLGPGGRVGLGLAITKMLVDAHGGSIAIERARGGGARVRVALPRVRPSTSQERPASWR